MGRNDVIALAACVVASVQMLFCPLYLFIVQVMLISSGKLAQLHALPPPPTRWYLHVWWLLFLVIPGVFLMTLILAILRGGNPARLGVAISGIGYFLILTVFAFLAVYWPLLELSKQIG